MIEVLSTSAATFVLRMMRGDFIPRLLFQRERSSSSTRTICNNFFAEGFSRIPPTKSSFALYFSGGHMMRVCSVAGLMILIAALATPAVAQGTADMVGRVADSSGAILPGVAVTARHLATNVSRTTVTSETGDYTFTALSIGEYEVK